MATIGPSFSLPDPGIPPIPLTDSGSLKKVASEEKLSSSLSDSMDMDDFVLIEPETVTVNPELTWTTVTTQEIFSKNVEITPSPTSTPDKPEEANVQVKPQWSLLNSISGSLSSLFFKKIAGDEIHAPLFNKIQALYDLEIPLEPKLRNALNAFLKEYPDEQSKLEKFFDLSQKNKDNSIKLLEKDSGELPLLTSDSMMEMITLSTELEVSIYSSEQDEATKSLALSIVRSGANRANYNNQVHTDLINWGVETDPNYFVGGGTNRTYEYLKGIEPRIAALEKEIKDPQTPNIEKKQRQLNKLKEMQETEYVPRKATRGIQQVQKWEEVEKNASGAFIKGFRRIGFKSKFGVQREVAVPLDLSFLPNTMTREQSKEVFKLMYLIDVHQEKPEMVQFLKERVLKERNPQDENIVQTPLYEKCQHHLDRLDFLSSEQKEKLVDALAVFTYRLMRDSQLNYLNT